ncbi:MAG: ATP-binding protein [Acidimicrobiia bacterium]
MAMDTAARIAEAWQRLPGQERVAAMLADAAARPVHAYLLVGDSGLETVARTFAAALVAEDGDEVERALRSRHPDVVECEPEGVSYRIKEDVRERIIAEALRAPIEGVRKVIIVWEAERLRADAANALLKTLEEPPARTVMLLCTAVPDELLPTVRSRCQRVEMAALSEVAVAEMLRIDGIPEERAALAARASGAQLERARALATRNAPLRAAFVTATARLDGSAAAAVRAAQDVQEVLRDATGALEAEHEQVVAEFEAQLAAAGYPDRTVSGMRTRLKKRHEREARRARLDALVEGITALETVYRDALAPQSVLRNTDRTPLQVDPRGAASGLRSCTAARRVAGRSPNEALLLERLFLHLPASV